MEDKYMQALNKLKKFNQEQLLSCYKKLDIDQKEKLIDDILNTDFEQINELYENMNIYKKNKDVTIEAIPFVDKEKLSQKEKEYYTNIGKESIKKGEFAVITMAGGQRNKIRTHWRKRNI